jgi:hypothetical protein
MPLYAINELKLKIREHKKITVFVRIVFRKTNKLAWSCVVCACPLQILASTDFTMLDTVIFSPIVTRFSSMEEYVTISIKHIILKLCMTTALKNEVFMAVKIHVVIFRVVILCSPLGWYQHFRGMYCLAGMNIQNFMLS